MSAMRAQVRTSRTPIVEPQSFAVVQRDLRALEHERGLASFCFGDLHLWAQNASNNSALVHQLLLEVERMVAAGAERPVWVLNGDTFDSKKVWRRTESDMAVEQMMQRYAQEHKLAVVSGNHDHRLIQGMPAVEARQSARAPHRRGLVASLSWLSGVAMPGEVLLAVHGTSVYGAHSGAEAYAHAQGLSHAGATLPPHADMLVLPVADKLFVFRHGDVYDTWYHRNPPRLHIVKQLKHRLALVGTKTYEGIRWLRMRLDNYTSIDLRDLENTSKRWFNGHIRGVCMDIAEGLTEDARAIEQYLAREVAGTVAGHTHTPLFVEAHTGYRHVNPGHARSDVGLAVITRDGVLHPPLVVAPDSLR
jgi:UDP-2,3-diacylglucosamine pyrophosphatase LpxH